MFNSDHHTVRSVNDGPALRAAALAVLLTVSVSSASLFFYGVSGALVCAAAAFILFGSAVRVITLDYPHAHLGLCNVITALRAGLVCLLVGSLAVPDVIVENSWILTSIAVTAFAMDGLDGWLARRAQLVSSIGARFDMETDAIFGATLALMLIASGQGGFAVLVLGFTRYVYLALGLLLPWLNDPIPESYRRKAVCVLQITALIILLAPIGVPAAFVATVAAMLLLWSFGLDIIWLSQNR
ncbi:MAG: CDP-alcohol phosphatidyltransferase family protein [Paracoccaceae bacterium]